MAKTKKDPATLQMEDELKTLTKHERGVQRDLTEEAKRFEEAKASFARAKKNSKAALKRIARRKSIIHGRLAV